MKGALIELLARGKQDELFITENPDISKFRTVYKKMGNYVRFECEQTITGNPGFGNTIVCDINKNGDLLTDILLEIKLPATGETDISWINSIGIYILKEVRLKIGGILIDEFTPEYIDAYYKHSVQLGRYASYAEMIKNFSGFINNTNTKESILYIPLPFWFTKSIGNAFPLISLGYMDIKVEIDFRSLSECLYSVGSTSTVPTNLSFTNCRIYTEMVYLPKEERCIYLATKEFDYLIEQKQYRVYSISDGDKNNNIKFNFNNPVKELMWVYRDNYHKNRNEWTEYTLYNTTTTEEEEPFSSIELQFNGLERIKERSAGFFRLVHPFRYHVNTVSDFFYFFSFCDKPDDFQPSGYVNMSLIDNAQIQFNMSDNIKAGEIYLYAINYNHLKIKNGMAGLLYN